MQNMKKIDRNVAISLKVLSQFFLNLVCSLVYRGHKYVNLIEIGPVVIEIWRVENGGLVVPVNNTLVCMCRMSFLVADTQQTFRIVNMTLAKK